MRIDLPGCSLDTCRYCFDGNCTDKIRYERCLFVEALNELAKHRPEAVWMPTGIEEVGALGITYKEVKCTNCGNIRTGLFYNYCPDCGAKMSR